MNANEPAEPMPNAADADPGTNPAAEAPPRPRRRRSTKAEPAPAVVAPAEAGEAPPAASAADPATVAEAPAPAPAPKPRAPRRRRVAEAAPLEAAASGPVASAPAGAAAELPPEPQPAVPETPMPVSAAAEAKPEVPTGGEATTRGEGEPSGAAHPTEGAAAREGGRRRNRRRNRGRDRGDRLPGAEDAAAEGDEAVAAGPDAAPLPATDPDEIFAEVVSGAFDHEVPPPTEETAAPAEPPKRVLLPDPDAPKLHKVLAQSGIGSRRDMELWVAEGRVTVNGEPAHIGQRISFGDRIAVDGKPVKVRIAPPPPRVLAYHKPVGEVVTHDDPQQRPTVFRKLPRLPHGKWQSVGRLDINTEGLLLFTNSGDLANQLMHPRFGVEREYAVRSLGVLDDEQRQRLLEGIDVDGQRAAFVSIADGGGEGANHWYRVVITEGRHREVRRLFEAVGHAVSRLIRIRYGCVVLPRGLRRGVWVDLPEADVKALRRLTGTDRPRDSEGGGRGKRGRRGGRNRDGRHRDGRAGEGPGHGSVDRTPDRAVDRGPRPEGADGDAPLRIPNPLQQTYDKRFIQQARAARRELTEDDPIPNPLQQTYDRRALQRERQPVREIPEDGPIPNPLQQTYDRRFVQKQGGGGGRGRGGSAATGGRQPDPMQTALGYIGADAVRGKRAKGGRGRGGKGGGGGGGGPRGGGRTR